MASDRDTLLSSFLNVTGSSDPAAALELLDAHGWRLDEAVNAFLTGGRSGAQDEEHVPAPLPQQVDQLIGGVPRARRRMREEPAPFSQQGDARLAALFAPPTDLMSVGTFDQVCEEAVERRRWLLVNVQDNSEFASLIMNRDVWKHGGIHVLVKDNFVLWQQLHRSEEGMRYARFYMRSGELPHIGIVDPLTRECLYRRSGKMDAPGVLAELRAFLNSHRERRPGAVAAGQQPLVSSLSSSSAASTASASSSSAPPQLRRQLTEAEQMEAAIKASLEEVTVLDLVSDSDDGGEEKGKGGDGEEGDEGEAEEEGEEEDDGGGGGWCAGDDDGATRKRRPPVPPRRASSDEQPPPAKRARTADEPPGPDTTRVQLRLPAGRPVQRRFALSDGLDALYDFARDSLPEADRAKPFSLCSLFPRRVLPRGSLTLREASVHNCSLALEWKD